MADRTHEVRDALRNAFELRVACVTLRAGESLHPTLGARAARSLVGRSVAQWFSDEGESIALVLAELDRVDPAGREACEAQVRFYLNDLAKTAERQDLAHRRAGYRIERAGVLDGAIRDPLANALVVPALVDHFVGDPTSRPFPITTGPYHTTGYVVQVDNIPAFQTILLDGKHAAWMVDLGFEPGAGVPGLTQDPGVIELLTFLSVGPDLPLIVIYRDAPTYLAGMCELVEALGIFPIAAVIPRPTDIGVTINSVAAGGQFLPEKWASQLAVAKALVEVMRPGATVRHHRDPYWFRHLLLAAGYGHVGPTAVESLMHWNADTINKAIKERVGPRVQQVLHTAAPGQPSDAIAGAGALLRPWLDGVAARHPYLFDAGFVEAVHTRVLVGPRAH